MISIVIPVYNAASFIDNCISSVVDQTFTNWKLILVNDGSTDDSLKICNAWTAKDNRISVLSQENSGAGAARNLGICSCQTRWITFIDADDTVNPTYLENFGINSLSPGWISIQGFRRINFLGKHLGEEKNFKSSYYPESHIVDAFYEQQLLDYGQTVGKLYETQMLKGHNLFFPLNFRLSEDHVFFLQTLPYIKGIKFNSGTDYNYIQQAYGNNLSSLSFPTKELWNRYDSLKNQYFKIVDKFNSIDISVKVWYEYFTFTGSISLLIQSIYKNNLSQRERRYWLNLIKNECILRTKFRPKSINGKFIKTALFTFPSNILDYMFSVIFSRLR